MNTYLKILVPLSIGLGVLIVALIGATIVLSYGTSGLGLVTGLAAVFIGIFMIFVLLRLITNLRMKSKGKPWWKRR